MTSQNVPKIKERHKLHYTDVDIIALISCCNSNWFNNVNNLWKIQVNSISGSKVIKISFFSNFRQKLGTSETDGYIIRHYGIVETPPFLRGAWGLPNFPKRMGDVRKIFYKWGGLNEKRWVEQKDQLFFTCLVFLF